MEDCVAAGFTPASDEIANATMKGAANQLSDIAPPVALAVDHARCLDDANWIVGIQLADVEGSPTPFFNGFCTLDKGEEASRLL